MQFARLEQENMGMYVKMNNKICKNCKTENDIKRISCTNCGNDRFWGIPP